MQSSPATASETRAGACARAVASADASHNLNGDGIAVRAAALHEPNSKHATAQRSWPSPAFGYPAVEELLRADRRKDEFLAILSHELRTPLASIQNALSILSKPTGENPLVRDKMHELIDRQADPSAPRSRSGLGLGLALVRTIVGLHGGSVTAESAGLDRGSEFIVHLPCLGCRRRGDRGTTRR
jgi:signal transduction histidine kinase